MTEKDFDRKIREKATLRENEKELGIWNKNQVWSQIESGLAPVRKKVLWWPAAAIFILFLLSAGWSVAQYLNIQKYKQNKDLEIAKLKEEFSSEKIQYNNQLVDLQTELKKKDEQIQKIHNDVVFANEKRSSSQARKELTLENQTSILKEELTRRDENIKMLQQEIFRLKNFEEQLMALQKEAIETDEVKTIQPVVPEKHFPSNKIHYLSNIQQQDGKKKGFSIKFLNSGSNSNVNYKSEHSLFTK